MERTNGVKETGSGGDKGSKGDKGSGGDKRKGQGESVGRSGSGGDKGEGGLHINKAITNHKGMESQLVSPRIRKRCHVTWKEMMYAKSSAREKNCLYNDAAVLLTNLAYQLLVSAYRRLQLH